MEGCPPPRFSSCGPAPGGVAQHGARRRSQLAQEVVSFSDVGLQLRLQRVDAVKSTFGSQHLHEVHSSFLPIEIPVEVDEVRLDQRTFGVLVEGGSFANIDCSPLTGSVGQPVPGRVDTVGRESPLGRNINVGGREPDGSAALITGLHESADLMRSTKHLGRGFDVTACHRSANCG